MVGFSWVYCVNFYYYLGLYDVSGTVCATVRVRRAEDHFMKPCPSLTFYMGSGARTQVIRVLNTMPSLWPLTNFLFIYYLKDVFEYLGNSTKLFDILSLLLFSFSFCFLSPFLLFCQSLIFSGTGPHPRHTWENFNGELLFFLLTLNSLYMLIMKVFYHFYNP